MKRFEKHKLLRRATKHFIEEHGGEVKVAVSSRYGATANIVLCSTNNKRYVVSVPVSERDSRLVVPPQVVQRAVDCETPLLLYLDGVGSRNRWGLYEYDAFTIITADDSEQDPETKDISFYRGRGEVFWKPTQ